MGESRPLLRERRDHHAPDSGRCRPHAAFEERGGGQERVAFDEGLPVAVSLGRDLIALDEALDALAGQEPRKSRVVELRYFGGLTVKETAEVLNVSADTVMRDWTFARAWLKREMRQGVEEGV